MTLWGGRFEEGLGQQAWDLNASIKFDKRMAEQDVRGSIAWSGALKSAGVLTESECESIQQGLSAILNEFTQGEFVYHASDEDIHTAVERRLGELIGPLSGKLHTGRSRNDQVATDFRLWLLDHLPILHSTIKDLQTALLARAEVDQGVIMPGYTHLQRAQPILLSHWWLAHFWPLQRDRERLDALQEHVAVLPLGSAALAGATFPIDRHVLAKELGFAYPAENSIDAVSDRDFAAEFLFAAAMIGVHLSRLSEAVILFSSAEFGFFELSDSFSTGSSLMPQKKNPDVFELARGKSGALAGYLSGMLMTLKGLPSTYDKDLQEDKKPVFSAYDTLAMILPVLSGAIHTLKVYPEKMRAAIDPGSMATDLADALVQLGAPFRDAHHWVGQAVQKGRSLNVPLDQITMEDLLSINPLFQQVELEDVFDPWRSVERHSCVGGAAPNAVQAQIAHAKEKLS